MEELQISQNASNDAITESGEKSQDNLAESSTALTETSETVPNNNKEQADIESLKSESTQVANTQNQEIASEAKAVEDGEDAPSQSEESSKTALPKSEPLVKTDSEVIIDADSVPLADSESQPLVEAENEPLSEAENILGKENIEAKKIPERVFTEEELKELAKQIDALEEEAKNETPQDIAPQTKELKVVQNVDDSEELAYEVGVSNVFDDYGREILEPVFENRLRMSRNGVKLAYSKLKNTILSYRDLSQQFDDKCERFKLNEKLLFVMEIGEDSVLLYLAIDPDTLDKETFGHEKTTRAELKTTPTKLIVKKETAEVALSSLERALKIIEKVMEDNGAVSLKVYAPVAYAQRYPLNPAAVLRGKETREPEENAYASDDYAPIEGEITLNIIKELMPPDHSIEDKKGRARLEAMRQQASTIKGAVAMAEPIVYFYDSAVNSDNTYAYVNVQQVLNDKFMGKIIPQQFFAVAESSERIIDLNLLTLKQVAKDCNENPKLMFATKISARLLAKKASLQKLLKEAATEHHNLILAFDCALLEALGDAGLEGINELKQNDIKIMLDGTQNAGLKILTEYPIAFLRFDARYYKENVKSTTAHLDMLTGYAKVQGIMTAAEYVDNTKMARFLQTHGVEQIQGPVVCEPKRMIYSAIKEVKKLPTFKK